MLKISFYNKRIIAVLIILSIGQIIFSCKRYIEVDSPINRLTAKSVFENDETAAAVLTDIYTDLINDEMTSESFIGISLYSGLYADELELFNFNNFSLTSYYHNDLDAASGTNFWKPLYKLLFSVNGAIEGLNNNEGFLNASVKKQLLGEAYFLRGYFYFYLVNIFGDVPLVLSTNWRINESLPRSSTDQVFEQIVNDLLLAQDLLGEEYLDGKVITSVMERVRPTKWAATALLARVYLYTQDLANAEAECTKLIERNDIFELVSLGDVFKKNSMEAIWQLQPVNSNAYANTPEGRIYILPPGIRNNNVNHVFLNHDLIQAFEVGDGRFNFGNWVDTTIYNNDTFYFANKYKIGLVDATSQEYSTMFRLGEIYLIRAEARAGLNKLSLALADLNMIRNRADLDPFVDLDRNLILKAIFNERRVELFTEGGHRWFDIKRSGVVNDIMDIITSRKGGIADWAPYKTFYPIPQNEIERNIYLTQNSGY